jgi:hypothetical protein
MKNLFSLIIKLLEDIDSNLSNEDLLSKDLFIEVEKKMHPISIQLEPLKRTNFKNL